MSQDIEKTLRPAAEDKTLRPEGDKTLRPAATDKTLRPSGDKTMRPGGDKTLRPGNATQQEKNVSEPVRTQKQEYTIDGVTYKLIDVLCDTSGEAQILLVESDGKQFVLKLYFPQYNLPPIEVMNPICQASGAGLLVATYAYGKWHDPADNIARDYELQEYCKGSNLGKVELKGNEKLLGEIALQCAVELDFLHQRHIIHRDVKPANFLFKEKGQRIEDLRLSDFGIALHTGPDLQAIVKSQWRTAIYTAPEYYFMIEGKIQLSYKSDFYSLGMMLLTLWDGKELYNISEFQLADMKRMGNIPYPTDVSDHTLQLLKALTDLNPQTRAGLPELIRWARGENIYDLRKVDDQASQFKIIFNSSKNQVAASPAELGRYMYDDKSLATKYLYSGKVSEWLTANKRPELAIEIDDIIENQYPKAKDAGLLAACYLLDGNIPYHDVEGNALTNSNDIALSLRRNAAHYEKALSDPNHSLYVFFTSHGKPEVAKNMVPLFKSGRDNADALRQFIIALSPTLPWVVRSESNKEVNCATIDDVIRFCDVETPDDATWGAFISESFKQWVTKRDPMTGGRLRNIKEASENTWCVLYNLNPKVNSYELQLDSNAPNYFFTAQDIGNYMNNMISNYRESKDDNSYESGQLDMMCSIKDTRLYYYLKSKDIYEDKIRWIEYCMDIDGTSNSKKYGPYNWRIGVFKAIKGLGFEPFYYFPKSKKEVYTLDELKNISSSEIKKELKEGYLADWLTTLFQENPNLDLSKKFTYERNVVKYIEQLEKLDSSLDVVKDYQIASQQVEKSLSGLRFHANFNRWSKIVLSILALLVVGAVTMFSLNTQFADVDLGKWVYWVSGGVGAIVLWLRIRNSFDVLFKCLVLGAFAAVAVFFAIALILRFTNYAIPVIFVAWALWVFYKCYYKDRSLHNKNAKGLLNPGFEERYLEPLHFVYKAAQGSSFKSTITNRLCGLTAQYKKSSRMLYFCMMPLLIVCGSASVLLANNDSIDFSKIKMPTLSKYEVVMGTYQGMFGENRAWLEIKGVKDGKLEGVMKVKFKNMVEEKILGEVDLGKETFVFDDVLRNGNLDGQYTGKFINSFTEMTGVYENYTTKKQVKFQLKKNNGLSEMQ